MEIKGCLLSRKSRPYSINKDAVENSSTYLQCIQLRYTVSPVLLLSD